MRTSMKTKLWQPSFAGAWVSSLVAATLLAGACVAPEFSKVDALDGAGGVGGATGLSTTTLGSGGAGIGSATTQSTNGSGGTGGSAGGSGGSSAGGSAGGSAGSTSTSTGTTSTDGGGGTATVTTTATSTGSGGTTSECSGELALCDGECVDLMTASAYCGSCDDACSTLEECVGGTCECLEGYVDCGSGCVQTSSNREHCGGCGQPCGTGEVCSDGTCTTDCGPGTIECDGGCVDADASLEHCGVCDNACDPGFVCWSGSCGCSVGLTECDGTCVDTNTSEAHCGGCNNDCDAGLNCEAGDCMCPPGTELCGGQCVDTATNDFHCGGCDTPCATRCEEGECVSIPGYWTQGALKGCTWTAIEDPVVGTTHHSPDDFTDVPPGELYCLAGTVADDYSAVSLLGFNLSQQPSAGVDCSRGGLDAHGTTPVNLTALGAGIALRFETHFTGTFRIQLQGADGATDPDQRWCAEMPTPDASGRAFIPFSAFNNQCWQGGSSSPYSGSPIAAILFLVPGAGPGQVTPFDYCVYGLAVGNSVADAP